MSKAPCHHWDYHQLLALDIFGSNVQLIHIGDTSVVGHHGLVDFLCLFHLFHLPYHQDHGVLQTHLGVRMLRMSSHISEAFENWIFVGNRCGDYAYTF
jgi:hypothetical protein